MLLVEEADYNLLGRDLIVAQGINLRVQGLELVVSLYRLTEEDESKIDPKVWYTQGEAGRLEMEPISIEIDQRTQSELNSIPFPWREERD